MKKNIIEVFDYGKHHAWLCVYDMLAVKIVTKWDHQESSKALLFAQCPHQICYHSKLLAVILVLAKKQQYQVVKIIAQD